MRLKRNPFEVHDHDAVVKEATAHGAAQYAAAALVGPSHIVKGASCMKRVNKQQVTRAEGEDIIGFTQSRARQTASGRSSGTRFRSPTGPLVTFRFPEHPPISTHERREGQSFPGQLVFRPTEATRPLVSLMRYHRLSEYQVALYEQRLGYHSGSPSRSLLEPDLYSRQILRPPTPVASSPRHHVQTQPEMFVPSSQYEAVEGDALSGLSAAELVQQLHLKDQLMQQSERYYLGIINKLEEEIQQFRTGKRERIGSSLTEKRMENTSRLQTLETGSTRLQFGAASSLLEQKTPINPEPPWKKDGDFSDAEMLQLVKTLFTCQLCDFNILKLIDQGCEAVVFLVQCKKLPHFLAEEVFAMKVMFNVFGHRTVTRIQTHYQDEFKTLFLIPSHPNIIKLFAFFYDRLNRLSEYELPEIVSENVRDNAETLSLFLIMEHIPQTLESHVNSLREFGELEAHSVMDWTLQILKGIQHLLKHRIVHRDLKLNNILFSLTDNVVKLCDFGCSIQLSEDMELDYGYGTSLGGNWAHRPPELLNAEVGSKISCAAQDLWATGVMIYEMTSGESPFSKLDQRRYQTRDLPSLTIKSVGVADVTFPEAFIKLVLSLLEYDPFQRPNVQSAITNLQRQLVQVG
jgi:hypothetical protein